MSAEPSGAERFRAEEERAIASLAGWIGDPAVSGIIGATAAVVAEVVKPIRRLLVDPLEVLWFAWRVFEIAPVAPGWEMLGRQWLLRSSEAAAIANVMAAFRRIVLVAAKALAEAGVPVDVDWAGDLAVVGELLLLEATQGGVPWEMSPRELAEMLQPPANSALTVDGKGEFQRLGASERAEKNTTAIRRDYERHLHGPKLRATYAGGKARAVPRHAAERRTALRKVLTAFPDATPARILATYDSTGIATMGKNTGKPVTPGGYLRHLLDGAKRPSSSTLAADLRILRAEGEARGSEKVSG